jgi:FkbM family methyltransferase
MTLAFADGQLEGPVNHPVVNLITYVRGGLYDYDAMTSLGILLVPGQTFIDVGASIGSYSLLAGMLIGADGHVIAIEPSATELPYLRRNLRDISAKSTICTVPIADQPRVVSMAAPGPTLQHLVEAPQAISTTLMTSTLGEELVRIGHRGSSDFAKIDVEGWEPAVIAGAREWLASRPMGLLVEANGLNSRSPVPWAESVDVLQGLGYEFTWPEFEQGVLHLFKEPGPVSPFGDYLVLVPETRLRLQEAANLQTVAAAP